MYSIKLTLDQRRQKKDGTYALVLRIRNKRRHLDLRTGVSLKPQQFDEKNQVVKGNKELQYQLTNLKNQYQTKIIKFIADSDVSPSLQELKSYLLKEATDDVTIESFWENRIVQLQQSGRAGGAEVYRSSLGGLRRVMNLKIPFHQLGHKELVNAEVGLLTAGVSLNSISVYFRTLRAICNQAILQEHVSSDWYPFKNYIIKKQKTTPRSLSLEQIQAYFQLDLLKEHPLYKTWCIGRLIFLLRGINLKDLLMLRPADIKSGRVIYRRSKTKKLYSIAILPLAKSILDELHSGGDTLVGTLDGKLQKLSTSLDTVAEYIQARKVVNSHLRRIGKLIGADIDLTTYVFRYTYANVAKQLGYSKDLIAEALGHEYGNSVTGIYLELFDLDVIDAMNDDIFKNVLVPCP